MLTKDLGCQLVISEQLARRAGACLEAFPLQEVDVRGRSGRIEVRLVADARHLPTAPRPTEKARRWWRRALHPLRAA